MADVVRVLLEEAVRGAPPTPSPAGVPGAAVGRGPTGDGAYRLRDELRAGDAEAVRSIVESTGFFTPAEVAVAVELAEDRLAKGAGSDYRFLVAEREGRVVGYTCYGEAACSVGSYDLYWIAVHESERGRGLGRLLDERTCGRIAGLGGRKVYAETAGKAQYAPTRAFYAALGYAEEARLADFYAPGDDKVVYGKPVEGQLAGGA
ncbi:MAG: GNAT family N-acetyltransferase [Phycisphaerales bacterium]|nr:GNAT family N-acetyltransferase [Phycisphaerales bacterium]